MILLRVEEGADLGYTLQGRLAWSVAEAYTAAERYLNEQAFKSRALKAHIHTVVQQGPIEEMLLNL